MWCQGPALLAGEHVPVVPGLGVLLEVTTELIDDRRGDGDRPAAGVGLRWPDEVRPGGIKLALLDDRDRSTLDVDVAPTQAEHLALPQSDKRGDEHHATESGLDRVGEAVDLGDRRDRSFVRRLEIARVVSLAVVAGLAMSACGGSDSSDAASGTTQARGLAALDVLLRESVEAVGLEPASARREVVENSCVGASGSSSENIRFYFDQPSHDMAADDLRELEARWSTGVFAINDPLDDDDAVMSLLAVSGEYGLEGWWFPASKELVIGGSTACGD